MAPTRPRPHSCPLASPGAGGSTVTVAGYCAPGRRRQARRQERKGHGPDVSEGEQLGEDGTFTGPLRALFQVVPDPATGSPYTSPSAAREINARVARLPPAQRAGRNISKTYVYDLVAGLRKNPRIGHLISLADLLRVPISALVDNSGPDPRWEAELRFAGALRSVGVRRLALRAVGLSAADVQALLDLMDHLRTLKGLPRVDDGDHPGDSDSG